MIAPPFSPASPQPFVAAPHCWPWRPSAPYRVVVTTVGFETLASLVAVEWIAESALRDQAPQVVANVDVAAMAGQPITWRPALQAITPDCVRIVLRGAHAMPPAQRPSLAF